MSGIESLGLRNHRRWGQSNTLSSAPTRPSTPCHVREQHLPQAPTPMLHYRLEPRSGVVFLTASGRLEASDFASLALTVDPYIARHGKLRGILLDAAAFPGWDDVDALIAHMRFVRRHHRNIERIAILTDDAFLEALERLAQLFTDAKIRRFATRKRAQAIAWLAPHH
ncbi:MAG: STAS/SEC14 domain-containing protein [Betaproteobacteria bacterium]|nr:STAS/SEC14 domain-containing protein [Betaproteobacteria bacterium]